MHAGRGLGYAGGRTDARALEKMGAVAVVSDTSQPQTYLAQVQWFRLQIIPVHVVVTEALWDAAREWYVKLGDWATSGLGRRNAKPTTACTSATTSSSSNVSTPDRVNQSEAANLASSSTHPSGKKA